MDPSQPKRPGADSADINRVIDLLDDAERPLVIAGSGTWWSDAGAPLEAFIEKATLPLFTLCLARGLVSDAHPLCFGYADPTLNRAAGAALPKADLVIVLGKKTRLPCPLGRRPLVLAGHQVRASRHSSQQELGLNRSLEVGIAADVKLALEDLLDALGQPAVAGPLLLDRRLNWRKGILGTGIAVDRG